MKSNYNEIIDIILTFIKDYEIKQNVAISGSIVPYLIVNKESLEYHSDFYFLVRNKAINNIRKKIKELSKTYEFDIISDSKGYSKVDSGFKIKYQNTIVGFFPYSIINNNFIIRTFAFSKTKDEIRIKTKTIHNISKNSVIRYINLLDDKKVRIVSPEFILADKEIREKQPSNPTDSTMLLLKKISDEEILDALRKSLNKININIDYKKTNKNNLSFILIVIVLLIVLVSLIYLCLK